MPSDLVVRPIGFVRSPFREKADAPRQAIVATESVGTVEVLPEYRDALSDLEGFERIWLLFWFDQATGWKSKVLPPRSEEKRGVFATRSPHRPNPIGMSAVRLERIDGLVLHIREIDLIDGTPILDIKPYIPYADAFPDASAGWLEPTRDPTTTWTVTFTPRASEMLAWILETAAFGLRQRILAALELGPQPHAYRRIREASDGERILAVKEWRVHFRSDDGSRTIRVEDIKTGFRVRDLAEGSDAVHVLHRAFKSRFA